MAPANGTSFLDKVVRIAPQPVVPLVVLGKGPLAEAVVAEVRRLLDDAYVKAFREGVPDEALDLYREVNDRGFWKEIYPATVWEGQPGWFAVLGDVEQGRAAQEALLAVEQLAGQPGVGAVVLPFLVGQASGSEWADVAKTLPSVQPWWFLVDMNREDPEAVSLLAQGVGGYLVASWLGHLTRRDGRIIESLRLQAGERLNTLGVARDLPDWDAMREGWENALRAHLVDLWTRAAGRPLPNEYSKPHEVVQELLPPSNYLTHEDPEPHEARVIIGQEVVGCVFGKNPTPRENRSHRAEEDATDRLVRLQHFRDALLLGEQVAAERAIAARAFRWQQEFRRAVDRALAWPVEPLGLQRRFRDELEHVADYVESLEKTRPGPLRGVRSFEANKEEIIRRENRIPSIMGLVFRLGLIGVGSFWTIWGTFFWATHAHPWNDPGMARFFWLNVGGWVGLVVLAAIQVVWFYGSLARAESLAHRDILSEYLQRITSVLSQHLSNRATAIREEMQERIRALNKLFDHMTMASSEKTAGKPGFRTAVGNPRFSNRGFDTLRDARMEEWARDAHVRVGHRCTQDERWLSFEPTVWGSMLEDAVQQVVRDTMATIDYDALVVASGWTTDEERRLVGDLKMAARLPWFPETLPATLPVLLLASTRWQAIAAGVDSVQVAGVGGRAMVALSVIPLRHPALDAYREGAR